MRSQQKIDTLTLSIIVSPLWEPHPIFIFLNQAEDALDYFNKLNIKGITQHD